jgi:hypothetical protein
MTSHPNPGADMNNQQLKNFRNIADQMFPNRDWQWIGKWESQRMFGISQERAEAYAKRHGGEAKKMA